MDQQRQPDQKVTGNAALIAKRRSRQFDVLAFVTAAVVWQRQQPVGGVGAQAKFRIFLFKLEVLDGILLRKKITKSEAAVVGSRFNRHGAMRRSILIHSDDKAVVSVVNLADLLIRKREIIDAAAGFAVRNADVRAKRRLIAKLEAKRRVIHDRFAMESG